MRTLFFILFKNKTFLYMLEQLSIKTSYYITEFAPLKVITSNKKGQFSLPELLKKNFRNKVSKALLSQH